MVGDFPTRVSAFDALRHELARRCAALPGDDVRCLDLTTLVFDAGNGIREELTDDQCHVNRAGAQLLRGGIDAALSGA